MFDIEQLKLIGNQIRKLREGRGLKQTDLAEALGFETVSVISKLENGNGGRQPALWKLSQIARQLGCAIDDLIPMQTKGNCDE